MEDRKYAMTLASIQMHIYHPVLRARNSRYLSFFKWKALWICTRPCSWLGVQAHASYRTLSQPTSGRPIPRDAMNIQLDYEGIPLRYPEIKRLSRMVCVHNYYVLYFDSRHARLLFVFRLPQMLECWGMELAGSRQVVACMRKNVNCRHNDQVEFKRSLWIGPTSWLFERTTWILAVIQHITQMSQSKLWIYHNHVSSI